MFSHVLLIRSFFRVAFYIQKVTYQRQQENNTLGNFQQSSKYQGQYFTNFYRATKKQRKLALDVNLYRLIYNCALQERVAKEKVKTLGYIRENPVSGLFSHDEIVHFSLNWAYNKNNCYDEIIRFSKSLHGWLHIFHISIFSCYFSFPKYIIPPS